MNQFILIYTLLTSGTGISTVIELPIILIVEAIDVFVTDLVTISILPLSVGSTFVTPSHQMRKPLLIFLYDLVSMTLFPTQK